MTTDVTLAGDRFEITVDGTRAGLTQFVDAGGAAHLLPHRGR